MTLRMRAARRTRRREPTTIAMIERKRRVAQLAEVVDEGHDRRRRGCAGRRRGTGARAASTQDAASHRAGVGARTSWCAGRGLVQPGGAARLRRSGRRAGPRGRRRGGRLDVGLPVGPGRRRGRGLRRRPPASARCRSSPTPGCPTRPCGTRGCSCRGREPTSGSLPGPRISSAITRMMMSSTGPGVGMSRWSPPTGSDPRRSG